MTLQPGQALRPAIRLHPSAVRTPLATAKGASNSDDSSASSSGFSPGDGSTQSCEDGGGSKPGSYGETDEFGFSVTENGVTPHDLQATILHLLGIDHERLTYRFQGRRYRLTDVHGRVISDLMA